MGGCAYLHGHDPQLLCRQSLHLASQHLRLVQDGEVGVGLGAQEPACHQAEQPEGRPRRPGSGPGPSLGSSYPGPGRTSQQSQSQAGHYPRRVFFFGLSGHAAFPGSKSPQTGSRLRGKGKEARTRGAVRRGALAKVSAWIAHCTRSWKATPKLRGAPGLRRGNAGGHHRPVRSGPVGVGGLAGLGWGWNGDPQKSTPAPRPRDLTVGAGSRRAFASRRVPVQRGGHGQEQEPRPGCQAGLGRSKEGRRGSKATAKQQRQLSSSSSSSRGSDPGLQNPLEERKAAAGGKGGVCLVPPRCAPAPLHFPARPLLGG